jgi:hypothetical protein
MNLSFLLDRTFQTLIIQDQDLLTFPQIGKVQGKALKDT